MKSLAVHYMNKYPGGQVNHTEHTLDVYDNQGVLSVSLRRDGHGKIVDQSQDLGAIDKHDMCPIPKNSRVHKICAETGRIKLDEKAAERKKAARAIEVDGKILSLKEYAALPDYVVDEKGNVTKKAAIPAQAPGAE